MSILIKGIPLGGYEISIMKDGERYRARVDGIWCEVEEIPTTDTDSDTISRAKAIEALVAETIYTEEELREYYEANSHRDEWVNGIYEAVEAIKQLPSAQPEQLEQCPIYGGMCAYPSDQCYDCPRHAGAKMEVTT